MQSLFSSSVPASSGEPPSAQTDLNADELRYRPKRRQILLSAVGDVVVALFALAAVVTPGVLLESASDPTPVDRTDVWRFDAMPANDDFPPLRSWAKSAAGVSEFSVARRSSDDCLVLRYTRPRHMGPVRPPWESWNFKHPYLVSREAVERTRPGGPTPRPLSRRLWWFLLTATVAMGIAARGRIAQARQDGDLLEPLFGKPRSGWFWPCFVGFLASGAGVHSLQRLVYPMNGGGYVPEILRNLAPATTGTILVIVLAVGLIGPFVEECLFRGLVYGRFRAYGYAISGALISSAMFAACHSGPAFYRARIFIAGLVLAWLYHRARSLWPPVAVHAVTNLLFVSSVV